MAQIENVNYKPIGIFRCNQVDPVQSPRQGNLSGDALGEIFLEKFVDLASLSDVKSFSHLWLIFDFNRSNSWKPKVSPPRGQKKRGVFATRSPYRPNSIGMSVVELVEISANKIVVKNHDLLDGTPILDIKPYLPYADSVPEANSGWTEGLAEYEVVFNEDLENSIEWLSSQLEFNLRNLLIQQLKFDPNLGRNKRVKFLGDRLFEFSYKTWRFNFLLENQQVRIIKMSSGYNSNDLIEGALDPWSDKELHRHFLRQFP